MAGDSVCQIGNALIFFAFSLHQPSFRPSWGSLYVVRDDSSITKGYKPRLSRELTGYHLR